MYASLHTHSYYSLLDGTASPEQVARRAADLGIPALALTDDDALYGVVPFTQACQEVGITPLIGAELTLTPLIRKRNTPHHLTLLAMNQRGYTNLCRLITLAHANAPKGEALLDVHHLETHAEGLICLSGSLDGSFVAESVRGRDFQLARESAALLHSWFGDRFYLELNRNYQREDWRITKQLIALADELHIPYVATPNAHYLDKKDAQAHDILRCIKARATLDRAGTILRSNSEFYLRSDKEMEALYVDCPRALSTTLEIAERCEFDLLNTLGLHTLPKWIGNCVTALRELCERGLKERYPPHIQSQVRAQLEHELAIIIQKSLVDYFLVVWDIVNWAREHNILCQGRGSAAGSVTAYVLYITSVDPITSGLVFERFLSPERDSIPDIDIDFSARRREEVIQYIYRKYGSRAAMVCTFFTFGARSAIRDVGFVLGFPEKTIDAISKSVDQHSAHGVSDSEALRQVFGENITQPVWQQLLKLSERLSNIPRHTGIHVGGMIVTEAPLSDLIPIEPAAMADRYVVQADKDSVDTARMAKIDILSLRTVTAIEDSLTQIHTVAGKRVDLTSLLPTDKRVYDFICSGKTLGIFQVESSAQQNIIPQMRPRNLSDLTIQIALIRPGPLQGHMVNPYLQRRTKQQPVSYIHPLLIPILEETNGVWVFQEQVILTARDVGGFTAGEGELLRRAFSSKRREEIIPGLRERFVRGAENKGLATEVAHRIFDQLEAFGSFSFAKSHSASFALLSYWHAWLRVYYPAAFFAGILRNEPMGFYPQSAVISEAQRAGVKFSLPDVNRSDVLPILETANAILLGLSSIDGISEETAQFIVEARGRMPFIDLNDFIERTNPRIDRPIAEKMILAGGCDCFGERRQLLWNLVEAFETRGPKRFALKSPDEEVKLKPFSPKEKLLHEFAFLHGLVNAHMMDLRADQYAQLELTPSVMLGSLRHGAKVRVGGVNTVRQRPPTAKGTAFLVVEDKFGTMNIIISKAIYERDRMACRSPFVVIDGHVQTERGVVNVIAQRIRAVVSD